MSEAEAAATPPPYLTLSFAFVDIGLARRLTSGLRTAGIPVWHELDVGGGDFASKPAYPPVGVVPLLRWAFEDSAALRKELTTLVNKRVTVVPVMVDGSYAIADWVAHACGTAEPLHVPLAGTPGKTVVDVQVLTALLVEQWQILIDPSTAEAAAEAAAAAARAARAAAVASVSGGGDVLKALPRGSDGELLQTFATRNAIAEHAPEMWMETDADTDSEQICIPKVETDKGIWFLVLSCDLGVQRIDQTEKEQLLASELDDPHALTSVLQNLYGLSNPLDFALCTIFEGNGSSVLLCLKSAESLVECIVANQAKVLERLGPTARAVLPYEAFRDLMFLHEPAELEVHLDTVTTYRIALSCLIGAPMRRVMDMRKECEVEEAEAAASKWLELRTVGCTLLVWNGAVFLRVTRGTLEPFWKFGSCVGHDEDGGAIVELQVLVEPDVEAEAPATFCYQLVATTPPKSLLWLHIAALLEIVSFQVTSVDCGKETVGFSIIGEQSVTSKLADLVERQGVNELMETTIEMTLVESDSSDVRAMAAPQTVLARWDLHGQLAANRRSSTEMSSAIRANAAEKAAAQHLKRHFAAQSKAKQHRRIKNRIRQIESNLGVVRPASNVSRAARDKEARMRRDHFAIFGPLNPDPSAAPNAAAGSGSGIGGNPVGLEVMSEKREGMRLAKLVWDLKTTKQFAGGGSGGGGGEGSPRARLSTHSGAFLKRAVRSSSSLVEVSEVSRRNDTSILKTQSTVIIEHDESMEFDAESSYASFNGSGYSDGGGGAGAGAGSGRGRRMRRSDSIGSEASAGAGADDDSSLGGAFGGYRTRTRARTLKWSKSSSDVDASHVSIHATPGRSPGRTEETKHLYIQYERRKIDVQYAKLQAEVTRAAAAAGGDGGGEAEEGSGVVLGSHVRDSMLSGGLMAEDVDDIFEVLLSEEGDATVVTHDLFYRLCTHALRGGDLVAKYRGNSP